MARLLVFLPFVVIGLMVWAIVDIVLFDEKRVKALPKPAWILVALVPILGPLLWILIGRGRLQRARTVRSGPVAPDDDPEFLRQLKVDKEQEERIRQLEERLAELDDDDPKP
jgi:type VI protein secretion system component VasK